MPYDPEKHHRRSIRLRGWDYAWPWWYFVTISVKDRACLLGDIVNDEMIINAFGTNVDETWRWLPRQFPHIELDEFRIMPNHLHGIIIIHEFRRGGSRTAPTGEQWSKPLGRLIGAFKTVSTKQINRILDPPGVLFWQRNYYDRLIRNDTDLHCIRTYIANNSLEWSLDAEKPDNQGKSPTKSSGDGRKMDSANSRPTGST